MYSDEKRNTYGSELSYTGKIQTERDLEVRLKIAKEKYEERLEAITDKVRLIFDEIRKDDVIAVMKEDPTSNVFISHRMKEICEDNLAMEREETIERLMQEVAYTHGEIKRLERETSVGKNNLQVVQDNFNEEKHRAEIAEEEISNLRNHLDQLAKEEENARKKSEESQGIIRQQSNEIDRLKENLEAADRNVWQKSTEYEVMKHELEVEKSNKESILAELNQLKEELQHKDIAKGKATQNLGELKELCEQLKDKAETLEQENEKLLNKLDAIQKEKQDQDAKYSSIGEQIKEAIDVEQKRNTDTIREFHQKYKTKSSRMKKKIIDQREVIRTLDHELNKTRNELDARKFETEKALNLVQGDMQKLKEHWERRCREIEKEHLNQAAEMQARHRGEILNLQREYEQLHEEAVAEFKNDTAAHMTRKRNQDLELKRSVDEKMALMEKDYIKISKHEAMVSEEISRLKMKHIQEIRDLEEQQSQDFSKRMRDLKEEHQGEVEKLMTKINALDLEKAEIISEKRHLDSELDFAKERTETLTNRLNSMKSDLNELENQKKNLLKNLDEATQSASKLKAAYEEESFRRQNIEKEIENERKRNKDLESSVRETEREFSNKFSSQNGSFQEQISAYESAIAREQANNKRINLELSRILEEKERLEKEKQEAFENYSRESQEFFVSTQRIKQEEYQKLEKLAADHMETKKSLIQQEHQCKFLESELENNQIVVQELKQLINKYERETGELKKSVNFFESSNSEKQNQSIKLKKELDKVKEEKRKLYDTANAVLKETLERFRNELQNLSKNSFQDLHNFKKSLHQQVSDAIGAIEENQSRSRRMNESLISEKDEIIKNLERKAILVEDELNETFTAKSLIYETNIDHLKASIAALKDEISSKNAEMGIFIQKVDDFQYQRKALEEDKQKLEEELRRTYESIENSRQESIDVQYRLKTSMEQDLQDKQNAIQDKYNREMSRYKEMVDDIKIQSERQMERLQSQVAELQNSHAIEIENLAKNYESNLNRSERELEKEARNSINLKGIIKKLQNSIVILEDKSMELFNSIEANAVELQGSIAEDKQKYQKFRSEKLTEIENLRAEMKKIKGELQLKNDIIEKLERDKEELKKELQDQSDSFDTQQIHDLRGKLVKTYQSTLESVKQAKALEKETGELSKRAKESPERRSSALSLSQLKASLEKY